MPAPKGQSLLDVPAPRGWSDVQWVQLASVGIDYYPGWLFDGPVVLEVFCDLVMSWMNGPAPELEQPELEQPELEQPGPAPSGTAEDATSSSA